MGMRPFGMKPQTIASIYKIHCQPKLMYDFEMININDSTLNELNSTQASLIKMNMSLSKFTKSTPLLNALKVESIMQIYFKFKILFIKQLIQINFTKDILEYLVEYYNNNTVPNQSFIFTKLTKQILR
jgi:hypothetical protein